MFAIICLKGAVSQVFTDELMIPVRFLDFLQQQLADFSLFHFLFCYHAAGVFLGF